MILPPVSDTVYACMQAGRFSSALLFATLWTVVHQAPLSMPQKSKQRVGQETHRKSTVCKYMERGSISGIMVEIQIKATSFFQPWIEKKKKFKWLTDYIQCKQGCGGFFLHMADGRESNNSPREIFGNNFKTLSTHIMESHLQVSSLQK